MVILDHGKCANNRTMDERNVVTRYPGFILWVSNHVHIVFQRFPLRCVGALYVNCRLIIIIILLLVFSDRNGEGSRIFCHSGYTELGRVLHPEYSTIGHGSVKGKSRVRL